MKLFGFEIKRAGSNQAEQRTSSNGTFANWLADTFGTTKANINVTDGRALGLSAFWQAVRIISETVATLPIGLYEVAENGNIAHLHRHRADKLIARRPSNLLTSYKFRETMQAIATVRGNSYAWIERDGVARPVALHILNPHSVTPFMSNGDLWYRIWENKKTVHHLDIIHIRGINILQTLYNDQNEMGLLGENPIFRSRESLAVGIAAQEFEGTTMGKGGHIDGILKLAGKIDPAERRMVEDSWQRRYAGFDGQVRTPVLGGGMEYQRIALTPQESMLMETRKFSVEEIARIINIPQHKLGHLDRASFNNIEQLARDFYIQTVRPWTENWESELEMKLLTEAEKESGKYEFRFDFNDLLRSDTKTLGELIRSLFNFGIISIDDGRRMMGLNIIGEEWSKKHWVQLNMAPADERPEPKAQTTPTSEQKFSTNGNGIHKN